MKSEILILGGGIAGLACRAALNDHCRVDLLEKKGRLGGLLQMYDYGAFIFDTTLHVLFFRDKILGEKILNLLPNGYYQFSRKNLVYQNGDLINYPYQYATSELPEAVRTSCIEGFQNNPFKTISKNPSFKEWLLGQFGPGFYKHFFHPYNAKLYGVPLQDLEANPMTWTIPPDNRDRILSRADTVVPQVSQTLFYPKGKSGIEALVPVFTQKSNQPLYLNQEVIKIDLRKKMVITATKQKFSYSKGLVSTLALPDLLDRIDSLPNEVRLARNKLVSVPLSVIQVGSHQSGSGLNAHWTYFPDRKIPFYRATRLELISPELAPSEGTSVLLEARGLTPPSRKLVEQTLRETGLLKKVDVYRNLQIPHGYVLFKRGYYSALKKIKTYLDAQNIITAGRFGNWAYYNIEKTILSGFDAAKSLTGISFQPDHIFNKSSIPPSK